MAAVHIPMDDFAAAGMDSLFDDADVLALKSDEDSLFSTSTTTPSPNTAASSSTLSPGSSLSPQFSNASENASPDTSYVPRHRPTLENWEPYHPASRVYSPLFDKNFVPFELDVHTKIDKLQNISHDNYSAADDSYILYRQNQFELDVGLAVPPSPLYFRLENDYVPVQSFYFHIYAVKHTRKDVHFPAGVGNEDVADLFQHLSAREKKEMQVPPPVPVVNGHAIFSRLQFKSATLNNARGSPDQPHPSQQYFRLVLSLIVNINDTYHFVTSRISPRLILRGRNPGNFQHANPPQDANTTTQLIIQQRNMPQQQQQPQPQQQAQQQLSQQQQLIQQQQRKRFQRDPVQKRPLHTPSAEEDRLRELHMQLQLQAHHEPLFPTARPPSPFDNLPLPEPAPLSLPMLETTRPHHHDLPRKATSPEPSPSPSPPAPASHQLQPRQQQQQQVQLQPTASLLVDYQAPHTQRHLQLHIQERMSHQEILQHQQELMQQQELLLQQQQELQQYLLQQQQQQQTDNDFSTGLPLPPLPLVLSPRLSELQQQTPQLMQQHQQAAQQLQQQQQQQQQQLQLQLQLQRKDKLDGGDMDPLLMLDDGMPDDDVLATSSTTSGSSSRKAQKRTYSDVKANQSEQDKAAADASGAWQLDPKGNVYLPGKVGINTLPTDEALTVNGNVLVTGNYLKPSDQRIKKNFKAVDPVSQLEAIERLKIYDYELQHQFDKDGAHVRERGVIAQELEKILPDAVRRLQNVMLSDGTIMPELLVVQERALLYENIGATKELGAAMRQNQAQLTAVQRHTQELKAVTHRMFSSVKRSLDYLLTETHGETYDEISQKACYCTLFGLGPAWTLYFLGFFLPPLWLLGILYISSFQRVKKLAGIFSAVTLCAYVGYITAVFSSKVAVHVLIAAPLAVMGLGLILLFGPIAVTWGQKRERRKYTKYARKQLLKHEETREKLQRDLDDVEDEMHGRKPVRPLADQEEEIEVLVEDKIS